MGSIHGQYDETWGFIDAAWEAFCFDETTATQEQWDAAYADKARRSEALNRLRDSLAELGVGSFREGHRRFFREVEGVIMDERIYHLDGVAKRCGVTRDTVLDWIERGLRAFPLGNGEVYRPRDYLIREGWVLDFLDAHSVTRRPPMPAEPESKRRPRRPRNGNATDPANPIIPCPV